MFLRATLDDGTQVVSEFSKLASVGRYATQVFSGQKAFNGWKVVGTTHPHSGEQTLVRERVMYNGRSVRSIEQVEPTTEEHGLDPANFQPAATPQRALHGSFTVPEEVPHADLVAGAKYPIHRDPETFRKYVIVKVATEEAAEVRHYLDGLGSNEEYAESRRAHFYGSEAPLASEVEEDDDDSGIPTEEDEWDGEEDD